MHDVPGGHSASAKKLERSVCLILAGMSVVSQLLGCTIGVNINSASSVATATVLTQDTKRAREILTDAIDKLSNRSSDWKVILSDALGKLPHVKDVNASVKEVVSTAIRATEGDFRCNADFLRVRVRDELIAIRADLFGLRPDPLDPVLCGVDPVAVDLSMVPSVVDRVTFYGYDFQKGDASIFLLSGVITSDVSRYLDKPSNYLMTLNLGSGGLRFTPASQRLVLRWDYTDTSGVALIQHTTRVCRTRVITHTPSPTSFAPPKIGGGDDEFAGHGPKISVEVHLFAFDSIRAQIFMLAEEIGGDGTEAYGDIWEDIYKPPPGWTVDGLLSGDSDAFMYTDTDLTTDVFVRGANSPVDKYVFVGDAGGSDIGKTGVVVLWAPLKLVEIEAQNCVSPMALRSIAQANLVDPARRSALEAELASVDPAILGAPLRFSPFSR